MLNTVFVDGIYPAMQPELTPGEAEAIAQITGDSFYVRLNDVEIASIIEGSYEDVMVWILFIAALIGTSFGLAAPAAIIVISAYLFFYLYEIPYIIMDNI